MARKESERGEITIELAQTASFTVGIVGLAPLILNTMSEKAWQELLAPAHKGPADRASRLKHDPIEEYRNSAYMLRDADAPTLLAALPTWFKQAMATAALDRSGVKAAQIKRLVRVSFDRMPLWGVPKLMMSIVRTAGQQKTPDVRTRAVLYHWATMLEIIYVTPMLRENSLMNLLASGGQTCGVGDWRQEKGSGSYGLYKVVPVHDPELLKIMETGARAQQQHAMDHPEPYDDDTARMLSWFKVEIPRRGFVLDLEGKLISAPPPKTKKVKIEEPIKDEDIVQAMTPRSRRIVTRHTRKASNGEVSE